MISLYVRGNFITKILPVIVLSSSNIDQLLYKVAGTSLEGCHCWVSVPEQAGDLYLVL